MKQALLALLLILVPVAGFTAVQLIESNGAAADVRVVASALGDLGDLKAIVADVQTIAATGDLAGAATRITDLETAWDQAQPTLRPLSPTEWGTIDTAIDHALTTLRARTPDASSVRATLVELVATLDNPVAPGAPIAGGITLVAGVPVTDANGHAVPCEEMLGQVRDALANGTIASANQAAATDFQAKATERCNADDDTRADEFAAQALALVAN